MKNRFITLWIISFFIGVISLSIPHLAAQEKITAALVKPDTISLRQDDSLNYQYGAVKLSDERHSKSGNLAMLFSAILPGAGQVYAHRYYTIPLIWGFGYYFVSSAIKANNRYMDFRGRYAESLQLDTLNHIGNTSLRSQRDDWHNFRDELIFYFAITYFLNILDAYVGATLYDFDVSENLGGSAKIQFRLPLH